jgi:hypothetical protein
VSRSAGRVGIFLITGLPFAVACSNATAAPPKAGVYTVTGKHQGQLQRGCRREGRCLARHRLKPDRRRTSAP